MPMALYRTVQYWDPSVGCKLSTVADYFVKRECRDLVELWKRNREKIISLDEKTGPDGGDDRNEIGDFVPDPESESPFERVENFELRRDLNAALACLSKRRRRVLQLMYFDGLTLSQAARAMGLTEKQTSSLQRLALSDLRKPKHRKLREYIDRY